MWRPGVIFSALALAACTQPVPDSGPGVGFSDYNSYNAAPLAAPATTGGFSTAAAAAAIDKAEGKTSAAPPTLAPGMGAVIGSTSTITPAQPTQGSMPIISSGNRARGNAPAGIAETTSEMANVPNSATVSDEQDFAAVSQRETIESDKQRIERNRAQYQIDQPTALPTRQGDEGANIVQFALSTSNPVGTQMYKRSGLRLSNSNAACAKYASPDLAQQAFLDAGGPEKDRKGLDADGDGYACGWNPAPFRAALK
jgi:hypothetical protein